MAQLTEEALWAQIKDPFHDGAYLFYGEEGFKVEEACRAAENAFAKKHRNYVRKVFYPDSLNLDDICQSAQGLSLFQESQFIMIRLIDQLKAGALDDLVAVCSEVASETTMLILTAGSLDKRKKSTQKFFKNSAFQVVQFSYAREGEFKVWAKNLAKRRERSIEFDAQNLLWDFIGPSLFELDMAIEKASLFAVDAKSLSTKHIRAVTVKTRQELVFAFTDAVASGDKHGALQSLRTLHQQGEEAIGIVALVARQFQWMLQMTSLLSEGKNLQGVIAEMKLFSKLGKALHKAASKRGYGRIVKSLEMIHAADVELKSSPVQPKLVLEQLTVRLTSL